MDEIRERTGLEPTPLTWPVGIAGDFRGRARPRDRRLRPLHPHRRRRDDRPRGARPGRARPPRRRARPGAPRSRRASCSTRWARCTTRRRFLAGVTTPVLFGSAVLNFGVRQLLDTLLELAPPPGAPARRQGRAAAARHAVQRLRLQDPGRHGHRAPRPAGLRPRLLGRLRARHRRHPRRDRQAVRDQVRPAGLRPRARDRRPGLPGRRRRPGQRLRAAGRRQPVRRRARWSSRRSRASRRSTSRSAAPSTPAATSSSAAASSSSSRRAPCRCCARDLRGDQAPVLAAVGPMQFEVAEHRMAGEFSAPVRLDRLEYTMARLTDREWGEVLDRESGVEVLERSSDGALLALFAGNWRLQRVLRDHPDARARAAGRRQQLSADAVTARTAVTASRPRCCGRCLRAVALARAARCAAPCCAPVLAGLAVAGAARRRRGRACRAAPPRRASAAVPAAAPAPRSARTAPSRRRGRRSALRARPGRRPRAGAPGGGLPPAAGPPSRRTWSPTRSAGRRRTPPAAAGRARAGSRAPPARGRHLSVPARRAPRAHPRLEHPHDPSHLSCAPCWRCSILGLSAFYAVTQEPRLGLDLRGGTSITLETQDSPDDRGRRRGDRPRPRGAAPPRRRARRRRAHAGPLRREPDHRRAARRPGLRRGRRGRRPDRPADLPPGARPRRPDAGRRPAAARSRRRCSPRRRRRGAGAVRRRRSPAAPPPAPTAAPSAAPSQGRAAPSLPGDGPRRRTARRRSRAAPVRPHRPPRRRATPSAGRPGRGRRGAEFDPSQPSRPSSTRTASRSGSARRPSPVRTSATPPPPSTRRPAPQRSVSIDFQGERRPPVGGAHRRRRPATQPRRPDAAASPSCSTARSSARRRSTRRVQCDIGIQGGTTQITGDFSQEEADELAVLIKGGALPVPVTVIASSTVGPTLGQEAIDASVAAGIIGLTLTALFLVVVYRFVGFLAAVALASVRPDLLRRAGRARRDADAARPRRSAAVGRPGDRRQRARVRARPGGVRRLAQQAPAARARQRLRKAFSAIADSNVTTLLAAGAAVLPGLRPGPRLRRHARHRCAGVDRVGAARHPRAHRVRPPARAARAAARPHRPGQPRPLPHLARGQEARPHAAQPHLPRHHRGGAASSRSLGMLVRGFNFGVEFTGGRVVEFATSQDVSVVRGPRRPSRTPASRPRSCSRPTARTSRSAPTDISETGGRADPQPRWPRSAARSPSLSNELIGPTLGDELRTKALIALVIALARPAGLPRRPLPLDLRGRHGARDAARRRASCVGIFAWLGKPIDGVFLAAALTIIGVSVNDSVVTMDRIRETWSLHRSRPLRAGRQRRDHRDRAAHDQHRSRRLLHPRRADGARRPVADRLRARAAHRPVRRHVLLGVRRRAAGAAARAAQQRAAADAQAAREPRRPARAAPAAPAAPASRRRGRRASSREGGATT